MSNGGEVPRRVMGGWNFRWRNGRMGSMMSIGAGILGRVMGDGASG